MSLPDPRIAALNNFTPTRHGRTIPSNLSIASSLPSNFTVLILGASEGIGEYTAYAYARTCTSQSSSITIILAARGRTKLERVRDEIDRIKHAEQLGEVIVEIETCDLASATSMAALSQSVQAKTNGRLDCVIVNAAYAPPVLLKAHLDQPENVQRAYNVNAMGTFHAAHYFVPMLLSSASSSPDSAIHASSEQTATSRLIPSQFIAIGSAAGSLRRGPIANLGYSIGKMAQTRTIEYLSEQYPAESLFSICIHPGAVMTTMAAGNTPDVFMPYLVDDVGLGGAFCVWVSKMVVKGELEWLNGRYVSANWDVDELIARRNEVEERDMLKFAMVLE